METNYVPEKYEANGADVEKVFLSCRGHCTPSISIGQGKQRKGEKIAGRFFNVKLLLRNSYKAIILPAINLQYGFRFNFKKRKDAENNK